MELQNGCWISLFGVHSLPYSRAQTKCHAKTAGFFLYVSGLICLISAGRRNRLLRGKVVTGTKSSGHFWMEMQLITALKKISQQVSLSMTLRGFFDNVYFYFNAFHCKYLEKKKKTQLKIFSFLAEIFRTSSAINCSAQPKKTIKTQNYFRALWYETVTATAWGILTVVRSWSCQSIRSWGWTERLFGFPGNLHSCMSRWHRSLLRNIWEPPFHWGNNSQHQVLRLCCGENYLAPSMSANQQWT